MRTPCFTVTLRISRRREATGSASSASSTSGCGRRPAPAGGMSCSPTLLFSVLAYLSDQLLTAGNTVAAIDELYLWLTNPVAVTYIRNCLKRVRKKESSMILASQNLEDFDQPGIRELTRPLFAIPTHQFIFYAGATDKRFYMDNLQLEENEYELVSFPQKGVCLYKCGGDRHLLSVHAPPHKERLFGSAGGR